MLKSYRGYICFLAITLVLFFISRQSLINIPFITYSKHIFTLICLLIFFCCCIAMPVKKNFIFTFIILIIYSFFLVYKNGIPIINVFQTLITLKYLIVYYVIAYAIKHRKNDLLKNFTILLTMILFVSIFFVLSDYLLPNVIFPLAKDGRGLGGISPGSFFASRVLYSGFLLLYSILLLSFKYDRHSKKYFIYNKTSYWSLLLLAFILIILTFSRKELLILIVVYGCSFIYHSKGVQRFFSLLFIFISAPFIVYILWLLIGESIQNNLNEGYVRYKIFFYAAEIFEYYFPFGSGPGTYGTVMSKFYTVIYSDFKVDKAIIGWGDTIDGPIFDLFFVSLVAEYGMGFLLVLYMIAQPFYAAKDYSVDAVISIKLLRINILLMLVGIGFMVPIMGNMVGLLVFFLLGILTSRNTFNENIKKTYV